MIGRLAAVRPLAFAVPLLLAAGPAAGTGRAQASPAAGSTRADSAAAAPSDSGVALRAVIGRHLGRPYVWGSSGLKSFDCSGFVWRVMQENGILIKRTTARKYFMTLPRVSEEDRWQLGNIVFFDHLKHCGIVESRETFYHAAVTEGTHRSQFDPLWRRKISGVRALPGFERPVAKDTGPVTDPAR